MATPSFREQEQGHYWQTKVITVTAESAVSHFKMQLTFQKLLTPIMRASSIACACCCEREPEESSEVIGQGIKCNMYQRLDIIMLLISISQASHYQQ